jgi:hypothetical protein
MRKLLRNFVVWVMGANNRDDRAVLSAEQDIQNHLQTSFRLGMINASNGRILEMSTYKRNPHGPDWTSELFIVPEDQTLAECISTILTVKGLT